MTFQEWWDLRPDTTPEDMKWIIEAQTRLGQEYQGLMLTNTYGQNLGVLVELNTRMVENRKQMAELERALKEYINGKGENIK